MDDKTFGVVSTISGLVVGWTLNELSSSFKSKRENKKAVNQILFIQLEIRDIIKKTNLDAAEEQLTKLFLERYPTTDVNLLNETVGRVFYGFLQNELNDKFSNKIEELIKAYKTYITSLSQIDPFVTYYISNKDVVLDYLGYIDRYLASIEPYLDQPLFSDSNPEQKPVRTFGATFTEIRNKITPFVRETAIETIEKDIKLIARRLGLLTYFKITHYLAHTSGLKFDGTDLKKLENYLNNLK
ncbi:MAG TPA: hypothetical protein VK705_06490 [Ferruginibacter sp.]|jgi:hypothetical protein|nr:hypothetical protein [Ferruginibacter sp.]